MYFTINNKMKSVNPAEKRKLEKAYRIIESSLIEPMIIEHLGKRPEIDKSVYIAPNATICGDVSIGKNSKFQSKIFKS